jgi:hypothetical protein
MIMLYKVRNSAVLPLCDVICKIEAERCLLYNINRPLLSKTYLGFGSKGQSKIIKKYA